MRHCAMLLGMRTTIDLDDQLLTAAKQLAAEEGRPLRSLVEEALRARLAREEDDEEAPALPVFDPRTPGTHRGVDLVDNAGLLDLMGQ